MTTDARLDLEFTNHPVELPTCRDLYSVDVWCKRPPNHDGEHAAGFGQHRIRWST